MRASHLIGVGLLLFGCAATGSAQEIVWKASKTTPSAPAVTLSRPNTAAPTNTVTPTNAVTPPSSDVMLTTGLAVVPPRIVRGQGPPPPPAFPGGGGPPPMITPIPGGDPYNFGVVNNDADLGGFWSRCCDKFKRCWNDVIGSAPGAFQSGPDRTMFQSDRCFKFASPVTNPFYFEDPRALTEIRPIFIWQHTPDANPIWAGGNNYHVAIRGSVAFTPYISFVVNRFGWSWIDPDNGTPDINSNNGFSEIHLGPKITFYRNEQSGTVAAFGLTFQVPVGSSDVLQDTGSLSVVPYFSIAQSFWRSDYGTFNFINTTGYVFRMDGERTDSIFSSFHLDYDVANLNRFYPLVEVNFRHYTRDGNVRDLNFEGNDLANFGSRNVSGLSELTTAIGGRFVINNFTQFGIAAEFNVLDNGGGRHLDRFRLTTDFIFRY